MAPAFNLDLFFDLSPDLLCIAGFDGYFKRINPAVAKALGYSREELMARPINDFVYTDDKVITETHRENLRRDIPLLNFENRYVTKGGEIVWLSWTSMPVERDGLVYAIAKDVTHKKKQEEDRNLLIAHLTKVNQDHKQLSYRTSHDLRSPVNNLLGVLYLLDTSRIQDEETLEFIQILRSATEDLSRTLDDYVDALSQREGLQVAVEELSLEESLKRVTQSLKILIDNSHAVIHADFSGAERVHFNKAYLDSVFLNLVTNAIKYARPGVAPVIRIRSSCIEGGRRLTFSDNGLGFDMDKVGDKVFGFRQQFHDHADSKGIGLYLVYTHITSLGGQISLESKPNAGTTFTITFRG